jgi:hypothetical protein
MTDDLARLEEKLDRITPIIEALGAILVRKHVVKERLDLGQNTLNNKPDKYEAINHFQKQCLETED